MTQGVPILVVVPSPGTVLFLRWTMTPTASMLRGMLARRGDGWLEERFHADDLD